jgi:hypothetical protein
MCVGGHLATELAQGAATTGLTDTFVGSANPESYESAVKHADGGFSSIYRGRRAWIANSWH